MWASQMVSTWLTTGMFAGDGSGGQKASAVVAELGDHSLTLSHARHVPMDKLIELGVQVNPLKTIRRYRMPS